jgi:NodT family efflux transporter outer membrane factor (OMF) lipoprotein
MKAHPTSLSRSRAPAGLRHPALRTSVLASLLALGGCMVGPDYKAPVTKSPEAWHSASLDPKGTTSGNDTATGNSTATPDATTPAGNTTATPDGNSTAQAAGNATAAPEGNTTAPAGNSTTDPGDHYTPPKSTNPKGSGSSAAMLDTPLSTQTSLVSPAPVTIVAWWTTFHDDQLNSLIQEAAARNLTVLQTQAAIMQARASVNVVSGNLWPSVNGDAGYTWGKNNGGASGVNNFQLGGNALWNFDVWGGVRRQIESAEASLQAAMENRDDALVVMEAQIGTAYVDLRTVQYLLQIAHTNLDIQEHTLKITQQRFEGGFVSRLDVENALALAANTRAQIPALESEALQDIYLISVLLGKNPEALVKQLEPTGPMLVPPPEIPVGLPSDLLRRRPDIRSAEAQLHAATANIGVAIAQLFPQFSLTSSLTFQAGQLSQLTKWANSSWTVGPAINWQIFAAGSIIANVHLQEAAQLNAFYVYKSTVLNAFQQVEDAMTAFIKEQQRRDALRESVEANQKATDLSMRLYKEGSTEFLNVLTAESGLYSSQQQLAVSEHAVAANLIALYQALGGGWSEFPEDNAVPLPFPQFPYAPPPRIPPPPHTGK